MDRSINGGSSAGKGQAASTCPRRACARLDTSRSAA
jgi:hypothetical protein